ncbi:DUF6415 family natural product biosynthesis protein [Streptomyces sp. NPDC047042]|uniref:DUF6415 family natural product biosynthesis protein n=1 Tax=Streptomyces sp. NPDC047042 TaxID=3154807 RepID=UPI0033FE7705
MTANASLPVDIEIMRASAGRLLAPDATVPSAQELETLMLMLKGHLALVIPEVERAAAGPDDDYDLARVCAWTAVTESRRKLRIEPRPSLSSHIAYARRLSRSLKALCDHYETLNAPPEEACLDGSGTPAPRSRKSG